MRSTELRLGNLVDRDGHISKVTKIATYGICVADTDSVLKWDLGNGGFSPIPLTKKWLERFGFEKATDAIGGYWSPSFGSNIVGLRWEFGEHIDVFRDIYWSYCVSGTYHVKAKYVHQLQNAIFVLLGKELELKP